MAVDELGLRVVRELLMELFHHGHLPALLRDLESVRQADQRLAHLHGVEASPTEAGHSIHSGFVRREDLATVKTPLKNYAKLRKLVDQWIDLGIELSTLRLEESRH